MTDFVPPPSRLVLQSDTSTPLGQISLAGYIHRGRGIPFHRPRVFGRFALVLLLEGSGRMRSGRGPTIPCHAGDLLFIYPEIPHAYGPGPGEHWSEFYLVFDGPVFDLWRSTNLLNPEQPVQRVLHFRRWLPQMEAVAEPGLPATSASMLRRVCRLQKLLADLHEHTSQPGAQFPWLESAMDILVSQPRLSPEAIARSLGMAYETFRKEFARRLKVPPARYRLHRLIEQARILITERNLSNKQIADTLGFYDEFHFSRRFRQVTGRSPRDFRRGKS